MEWKKKLNDYLEYTSFSVNDRMLDAVVKGKSLVVFCDRYNFPVKAVLEQPFESLYFSTILDFEEIFIEHMTNKELKAATKGYNLYYSVEQVTVSKLIAQKLREVLSP